MDRYLYTIHEHCLQDLPDTTKLQAINAVESGKVIYLPTYSFTLIDDEQKILTESILDPKHKNISYDYLKQRVAGIKDQVRSPLQPIMQKFLHRFALFSKQLINEVLPQYQAHLQFGRTSFRPAEIKGRKSSKRKDDTRLHVDSFSSSPVNGLRILRVFCNINPYGEPRVWQVGESFSNVLNQFSKHIPPYRSSRAKLLKWVKATKTLRSPYDHYMLHLHDFMKLDDVYQQKVTKQRIAFPSESSWIVFTDHVSHAALSGQFLLEQTFYLPVSAMLHPSLSPLKQWEKEKDMVLI